MCDRIHVIGDGTVDQKYATGYPLTTRKITRMAESSGYNSVVYKDQSSANTSSTYVEHYL
jgi:hypothetical protein